MCGWAAQVKLACGKLRRRGHVCEVLKINGNRQVKDPSYMLRFVAEHYDEVKAGTRPATSDDNVAKMADWLVLDSGARLSSEVVRVG